MSGCGRRWLTTMLMLLATAAAAQSPTPIVERVVTIRDRMVRLSLFSNKVVVVTASRGDERILMRRLTLSDDEYIGYLAAVQRDAAALADADDRPRIDSSNSRGRITLHIGPEAPRTIEYSTVAVLDLATSRLVAALDDLEARVMWGAPTGEEFAGWLPKKGDRVELRSGGKAKVIEVWNDGTLVLEHESTYINEIVKPDQRAQSILRVLE